MQNLVSFCGMFVLIFLAWLISDNRRAFPWRVVVWGIALQMAFGFLVLWWEPGSRFFLKLNDVFNALLGFSKEGAVFVFNSVGLADQTGGIPPSLKDYLTRLGAESKDPVVQLAIRTGTVPGFFFAFQVLTTIIFFSALISVLYYLGVMQKIVLLFAKIMARTMRVSGAESLSNSANIFVGQTEAPLVVRPYIEKMTKSEIMAIMVGGFANTAGGVLGAYVMMLSGYFPNVAAHLISASLLSAPAAFIFAKVMVPEREDPLTMGEVRMDVPIEDANLIDAAANGTTVGWQLAINVAAMLISFVALIAMANLGVTWVGGFFHDPAGFVHFNLMAAAAIAALLAVERYGPQRDLHVWVLFVALVLAFFFGKALLPGDTARKLALIGLAAWLPLFLQMYRKRPYGAWGWGSLLAIAVAADLVYFLKGPLGPDTKLSLQLILGWMHWPIAFCMGVPAQDCLAAGKLLGEKLILTEFIAYLDLSSMLGAAGRGEIPAMDPRSIVIVSYALCGFSNFASIAIQIGGISPLAPSRRHDIARLGFKAMVGGALATFMIACVAGTFYTGRSMLGIIE
ncbi:MAG: hypothetical protein A3G34_02810 [Candidatus Lindowbacteria bacterium RIFCSPLOWO2_12_FULL_62_27]|nr:MAG: hypothetical protein A3G34_02810 [Candidatus Lindowbacteria bacterium RIFCSPLOWO2_12_FULL_62_27]